MLIYFHTCKPLTVHPLISPALSLAVSVLISHAHRFTGSVLENTTSPLYEGQHSHTLSLSLSLSLSLYSRQGLVIFEHTHAFTKPSGRGSILSHQVVQYFWTNSKSASHNFNKTQSQNALQGPQWNTNAAFKCYRNYHKYEFPNHKLGMSSLSSLTYYCETLRYFL